MTKVSGEVAKQMKKCMIDAVWTAAYNRWGYKHFVSYREAEYKSKFETDCKKFKDLASGVLSGSVCDDIKWMFWNAAWGAANEQQNEFFWVWG